MWWEAIRSRLKASRAPTATPPWPFATRTPVSKASSSRIPPCTAASVRTNIPTTALRSRWAATQYFQDQELNTAQRGGVAADGINSFTNNQGYGFVDGWGASFGVHYPVAGGTLKGQISYRDMDNQNDVDFTRWTVAAGYDYSLSKRTAVYAMAGYSQEKLEKTGVESATPNGYQIVFGTVHRF